MKRLVKGQKVLAAILSVVVIMGAAIPVNAASTDVNIEVKETTMDNVSVTVPTTVPIVFNEDGTNTLPSNWTIENISSIAGIHLSTIGLMHTVEKAAEILVKMLSMKQDKLQTITTQNFRDLAKDFNVVLPEKFL